jgi:hypothetical protein
MEADIEVEDTFSKRSSTGVSFSAGPSMRLSAQASDKRAALSQPC